jgi:hypothetical protein
MSTTACLRRGFEPRHPWPFYCSLLALFEHLPWYPRVALISDVFERQEDVYPDDLLVVSSRRGLGYVFRWVRMLATTGTESIGL